MTEPNYPLDPQPYYVEIARHELESIKAENQALKKMNLSLQERVTELEVKEGDARIKPPRPENFYTVKYLKG